MCVYIYILHSTSIVTFDKKVIHVCLPQICKVSAMKRKASQNTDLLYEWKVPENQGILLFSKDLCRKAEEKIHVYSILVELKTIYQQ